MNTCASIRGPSFFNILIRGLPVPTGWGLKLPCIPVLFQPAPKLACSACLQSQKRHQLVFTYDFPQNCSLVSRLSSPTVSGSQPRNTEWPLFPKTHHTRPLIWSIFSLIALQEAKATSNGFLKPVQVGFTLEMLFQLIN